MLRFRGKVAYRDGTETEFECGTAGMAEYESYALRHGMPIGEGMPPVLGTLVIAHYALGIQEGFDVWRRKVDGVEMDADGIPPTQAGATAG